MSRRRKAAGGLFWVARGRWYRQQLMVWNFQSGACVNFTHNSASIQGPEAAHKLDRASGAACSSGSESCLDREETAGGHMQQLALNPLLLSPPTHCISNVFLVGTPSFCSLLQDQVQKWTDPRLSIDWGVR
ncbi:hypothetical protein DFH06DRAFT_1142696 [Mycena polygramma]|nr:hypothetical protein DFH06DRAFT_1142696 [Mycena polygramma]